MSRNESYPIPK